jgi:O-antigen/teichoic acid export membrane protein
MLFRNGALLILNSGYAVWLYLSEIHQAFRPKFNILREFASISSAAFLSKLGSAGLGKSEAALIAIFIHPEMATMFVLTRRAADIVRMLIDRFGGAVFAGFSHLVGEDQRESAAKVYVEVLVIYTGVSVVLVGTYLAVNQTFMSVWVGSEQFGGEILTILIGFSVLIGGRFGLLSYLYGATGQIARSAYIVFFESIGRFALMIVLLWWIGMPGLPLAAIVTTFVAGEISQKWMVHELGVKRKIYFNKFSQWSYLFLLIVGSYVGIFIWAKAWAGVTIMLTVTILIISVVAILSEPYFRKYMITKMGLSEFRGNIQK